jgi:F-type H+-transporting ATPase subunit b
MPQIAQIGEIYASQLFWLAVTFGLIFIIVGLGMVPKIQSTIDARDARIAADLVEAERARTEADRIEDEYRQAINKARAEATKLAAEAKAESAKKAEQRVAAADKRLQAKVEKAEAKIAEARASAVAELEAVAAEAAQQMVERVSPIRVEPQIARAAVQKELAHG